MYPVQDPSRLKVLIQRRLPLASHVYNQVLFHPKFPQTLFFYTAGEETNDKTWILTKYVRKNGPTHWSISAPDNFTPNDADHFKSCLVTTDAIDWNEHLKFVCVSKAVSKLIVEVSLNVKRVTTTIWPNLMFKMSSQVASNAQIPEDIHVRSLSAENGDEKVVTSYWKNFDTEGDIVESIKKMPSAGVFVEGKCVAGVSLFPHGLISGVFTFPEHRQKGYAGAVMKFVSKKLVEEGGIPCSTVEEQNLPSIKMHQALGMEVVDTVDWVEVLKFHA